MGATILGIMTLSIKGLFVTLSITAFSNMTLSIVSLFVTLTIYMTLHK